MRPIERAAQAISDADCCGVVGSHPPCSRQSCWCIEDAKTAITAFLDAVLADEEAMFRIGLAAGDTGSAGKRWIEALKQEVER